MNLKESGWRSIGGNYRIYASIEEIDNLIQDQAGSELFEYTRDEPPLRSQSHYDLYQISEGLWELQAKGESNYPIGITLEIIARNTNCRALFWYWDKTGDCDYDSLTEIGTMFYLWCFSAGYLNHPNERITDLFDLSEAKKNQLRDEYGFPKKSKISQHNWHVIYEYICQRRREIIKEVKGQVRNRAEPSTKNLIRDLKEDIGQDVEERRLQNIMALGDLGGLDTKPCSQRIMEELFVQSSERKD